MVFDQKIVRFILFVSLVVTFSSCGTTKQKNTNLYDPKQVAELSQKLGIELNNTNKDDDRNMALYAESSLWLGVPYRYGGNTRRGLDCSGLSHIIYKNAYGVTIPRSTAQLTKTKMKKVSRSDLKPGDLVFFATSRDRSKITHVGIYLKDGRFIHASTKRGVVVDNLTDGYYHDRWIRGGRFR